MTYVVTALYVYGEEWDVSAFKERIRGEKKAIDFELILDDAGRGSNQECCNEDDSHGALCPVRDGGVYGDIWIGNRLQFFTKEKPPIEVYCALSRMTDLLDIEIEGWWANENIRKGTGCFWIESGRTGLVSGRTLEENLDNYENAWGTKFDIEEVEGTAY